MAHSVEKDSPLKMLAKVSIAMSSSIKAFINHLLHKTLKHFSDYSQY